MTTSPGGTPQETAGVLGASGTSVLLGSGEIDPFQRFGGRISFGYRFWPSQGAGMAAVYSGLAQETATYSAASDVLPIIARPFVNVDSGDEDAALIAFPNMLDGRIAIDATTRYHSVEVLLRQPVAQSYGHVLDFLAGYRFSRLDDELLLRDSLVALDPASGLSVGTSITSSDLFDTTNQFHGLELGLAAQFGQPLTALEVVAKLALGSTRSEVVVNGETTRTTPGGASATGPGGLLSLPSNIGTFSRDEFALVPEFGLTLTSNLTCRLQVTFGYTLVYWSRVARPGDQIDRVINVSQLPPGELAGPARPEFSYGFGDFWAQGLHFGLHYRF